MTDTATRPSARLTLAIIAIAALAVLLAVGLQRLYRPTPAEMVVVAERLLERALETRQIAFDAPEIPLPPPAVSDPEQRKTLFIAAMLPLITRENARIEDQRRLAETVTHKGPAYAALAQTYGLAAETPRETLLTHIDIVPAALALAQGAIESGWGTSRFAREGNAYFGERTFGADADGIAPEDAQNAITAFKVKSFPNAGLSVRSFMRTINTHPAYRDFRDARERQRQAGRAPSGLALAPFLTRYSEIGQTYVQRIVITIEANGLSRYNGLRTALD